ncbi:MAG TPA: response regulator [Anaerolineales bacterium]|jgi:pilus assembly protein CpaE|nr:response regulator [Anaerolineales bacterium]
MAGSKILIIDADQASRTFVAAALQKEGHQILQAGSGKEGLIVAWRDRPEIIIADPVLADLPGEDLAGRLRSDGRTAKTPLIALSSDANRARIRSCREAGFNEYLIKTPQAIPTLLDAIKHLVGGAVAAIKQGGLLIVFLSAKGGTGTSSLCANIAMNIAINRPEARVAVADMVLPIGSIAGVVGYEGVLNLATVADLSATETPWDFYEKSLARMEAWRFNILAGSPDPDRGNDLNVVRIPEIVNGLKATYDFILLDLGRSLSRISLPLIQNADLIAMIVSTDLSTVQLTKTVLDYLMSKGVESTSVFTILNRAVGLEGLTKQEAEKILGIEIKTAIPYLGGTFALANNQHQPFTLKYPKDTASLVMKETAVQMAALAQRLRAG